MTDADLLTRCLAHDRAAWNTLVERFSALVYSVIHHTLNRHHVASTPALVDDLFGGAFLALYDNDYRRLRQWKGKCSLASWIRLIVSSTVVDQLRRRRPDVPVSAVARAHELEGMDDAGGESVPAPDAAELLERAERIGQVRAALAQLAPGDRALLEQLYVLDTPPGILAVQMGIRPGALYTRKNRALARLRALIEGTV